MGVQHVGKKSFQVGLRWAHDWIVKWEDNPIWWQVNLDLRILYFHFDNLFPWVIHKVYMCDGTGGQSMWLIVILREFTFNWMYIALVLSITYFDNASGWRVDLMYRSTLPSFLWCLAAVYVIFWIENSKKKYHCTKNVLLNYGFTFPNSCFHKFSFHRNCIRHTTRHLKSTSSWMTWYTWRRRTLPYLL